jgi:hypothetical protein
MPLEPSAVADESEVVTAAFADQVSVGEGQSTSRPPDGTGAERSGARSSSREAQAARRVGSPFAKQTHGLHVAASLRDADPGLGETGPRGMGTIYQSRAKAGVIAGFVLGLFGIVACFFTVWAVIAAVVGLGLGLWGLSSAHRGTAVVTILLCCLTLLIGSFFGLADWYESRYGYKPWDAPAGWREG